MRRPEADFCLRSVRLPPSAGEGVRLPPRYFLRRRALLGVLGLSSALAADRGRWGTSVPGDGVPPPTEKASGLKTTKPSPPNDTDRDLSFREETEGDSLFGDNPSISESVFDGIYDDFGRR